jgi:hypothetical protein
MKLSWMEPAYEGARTWALQPISHPPGGWALIVRRGIASMPLQGVPEPLTLSASTAGSASGQEYGLLAIVAAMIAQVCQ